MTPVEHLIEACRDRAKNWDHAAMDTPPGPGAETKAHIARMLTELADDIAQAHKVKPPPST